MTPETLFLGKERYGVHWLIDSRNNSLGSFTTVGAAKQFARENGYRLRIETSTGAEWYYEGGEDKV